MADAGAVLDTIDILKLMKLLPHRYPFLLVDRVMVLAEVRTHHPEAAVSLDVHQRVGAGETALASGRS